MGRSFRRKAAEVILPPKSAPPMPYDTEQVSPSLFVAISPSPPTFVLFAQAMCSRGRDSHCIQIGETSEQAERQCTA